MKSLFVLFAIGHICLTSVPYNATELRMLCCLEWQEDDMKSPFAVMIFKRAMKDMQPFSFNLTSAAIGGDTDEIVDAFVTKMSDHTSKKRFVLYTLWEQWRLGVDKKGKIELDLERTTTFRVIRPCGATFKFRMKLYETLCAIRNESRNGSRSESHFIVSMKPSRNGFSVKNCDSKLTGSEYKTFCENDSKLRKHFHDQLKYPKLAAEMSTKKNMCSTVDCQYDGPTP